MIVKRTKSHVGKQANSETDGEWRIVEYTGRRAGGEGSEGSKVAKESFRFHRTNDIVRHSIIPTVCQRSYRDNIADDIIRIMFAVVERKAGSPLRSRGGKRPRGKNGGQVGGRERRGGERRGLILHVEDKSSGELLKHSI